MSVRNLFLATSAAALLAGSAFADGGPIGEAPPPPPQPAEQPYTPAPAPAAYEREPVWYADLHGGVVWLSDIEFTGFGDAYNLDSDIGWAGGLAIGYRYDSGFRFEFEGTYRRNDGEWFDLTPPPPVLEAVSETTAINAMLNGVYDFDMGSMIKPYLGAGLGAAYVNVYLTDGIGEEDFYSWAFAYQFLGGFSVPMPNTEIEFFADYRYLRTAGFEPFDAPVDNDEYQTHSVMGGLRFNF